MDRTQNINLLRKTPPQSRGAAPTRKEKRKVEVSRNNLLSDLIRSGATNSTRTRTRKLFQMFKRNFCIIFSFFHNDLEYPCKKKVNVYLTKTCPISQNMNKIYSALIKIKVKLRERRFFQK